MTKELEVIDQVSSSLGLAFDNPLVLVSKDDNGAGPGRRIDAFVRLRDTGQKYELSCWVSDDLWFTEDVETIFLVARAVYMDAMLTKGSNL